MRALTTTVVAAMAVSGLLTAGAAHAAPQHPAHGKHAAKHAKHGKKPKKHHKSKKKQKKAKSLPASAAALTTGGYVTTTPTKGAFTLEAKGGAVPVVVDNADYAGVKRVAGDLADDIKRVTGVRPRVTSAVPAKRKYAVIIGTLGHSPLIDRLAKAGKISTGTIQGKWETSIEQVVNNPLPGVKQALVIAGGDQRGSIYGAYDISKNIGVSPWYWWDDVKPAHQSALYVNAGTHTQGTPAVKYRGFFINDENPSLGRVAARLFGPGKAPGYPGGFNHLLYEKVFEAALRLKANYIWPAVWGRTFDQDDPQNQATATRYGIVMGSSHEAPMAQGIESWNRQAVAPSTDANGNPVPGHDSFGGDGEWSFVRNKDALIKYWTQGIAKMKANGSEQVVTMGMRGNGDTGLADGDGAQLMKDIFAAQEKILDDNGMSNVPKVWTLYKEVQRYWDTQDLRPADDVTVNFTDDNWGNIRHLPDPNDPDTAKRLAPGGGGFGLYYHFDYVGGGRDYKWADSTNLANTWEQLHLAYNSGVQRLWVTNVGDLKENEAPTQFFLDYAWNPNAIPVQDIWNWEKQYAEQNFGKKVANQVADVLTTYSQLQARRKPELLNRRITLDPTKDITTDNAAVVYNDTMTPFSMENYDELNRVTSEWQALAAKEKAVKALIPAADQDAFFELVGNEVESTAVMYQLRQAEFTNIQYAAQGRASTNALANQTDKLFNQFEAFSTKYDQLVGGKWADFETQPVLGYGDIARYGSNAPWQEPELNDDAISDEVYPAVQRITLPYNAPMGVMIDGSSAWWPGNPTTDADGNPVPAPGAVLPSPSRYQTAEQQYIEIFDRGRGQLSYTLKAGQPYVTLSATSGSTYGQDTIKVGVDWSKAPAGLTEVPITVTGSDGTVVTVTAPVDNRPIAAQKGDFLEAQGYVAINAVDAAKVVNGGGITWQRIAGLGQTGDVMDPMSKSVTRVDASTLGASSAQLDYHFATVADGDVTINTYVSPRSSVVKDNKLEYAVSVDGGAPQVVDVIAATGQDSTSMNKRWERNTSDNINVTTVRIPGLAAGHHTLEFYAVDPNVVLQRLVVNTGGLRDSYLGPKESKRLS